MDALSKGKDDLMSFLSSHVGSGGNPFATPVGTKIEQATDPGLASENWALNLEICDLINSNENNCKDALRAIRKRLAGVQSNKNYTIVMYALTVLETCVKNCGRNFHILVCGKEFVQEMVKLIGPKYDPPLIVQEKVLSLIESWAETFRNEGSEFQNLISIYEDLKCKGIEFPATDFDAMAPILMPPNKKSSQSDDFDLVAAGEKPKKIFSGDYYAATGKVHSIMHPVQLGGQRVMSSGAGRSLTVAEVGKLRGDLGTVQSNMSVFNELLSEVDMMTKDPKRNQNPDTDTVQLLSELSTTCQDMQSRIGDLLATPMSVDVESDRSEGSQRPNPIDELLAELLHCNDELNNVFLRYNRFLKNQEKKGFTATKAQASGGPGGVDLIDFGPSSASAQPKKDNCDEFAAFAQSRTGSTGTGAAAVEPISKPFSTEEIDSDESRLQSALVQAHRESDFDEMEAWLEANPVVSTTTASGGQASMTSSEFDRFLAERAAKANPP